MSGIDSPIKKFVLLPRDAYETIVQEKEKKEAEKRANEEAEKKARAAKQKEEQRLEEDAFVKREVELIIDNIALDFASHKKKLITGEYSSETFRFDYYCQNDYFGSELWERIVQQVRSAIEKLVPTSNLQFSYRQLRCEVSLVVRATEETQ